MGLPGLRTDLDVLHVMFWHEKRTSVAKIVDNIVANQKQLRQGIVSFPDDFPRMDEILDRARPKIVHLHYEREHPETEFMDLLRNRPRFVQTIHSSAPSIFTDIVDKIVCIDEFGLENNDTGKSVLIENSVDVGDAAHHQPNRNGVCNAIRFSPDQMQTPVIDLFGRLNTKVTFYGADDFLAFDSAHNRAIIEYAKNYDNIECVPYCAELERTLAL